VNKWVIKSQSGVYLTHLDVENNETSFGYQEPLTYDTIGKAVAALALVVASLVDREMIDRRNAGDYRLVEIQTQTIFRIVDDVE
jgi:uncharacterized protein (DUF1499 family)